jgi:hypothetical protein
MAGGVEDAKAMIQRAEELINAGKARRGRVVLWDAA